MRWGSLTLVALGILLCVPTAAHAYRYSSCNGGAYTWSPGRIDMHIMSCSAPDGSQKAADIRYSLDEWNAVQGMVDVFEPSTDDACQVRTGNGVSEIGFVAREAIDGALGLTLRRYSGGCWAWTAGVRIIEADVFINADATLEEGNPQACNVKRLGQRTTIMHELGHALGLNHYDDHMSLMMTSDGEGKYCGTRMVEPHPDDAMGARRLYPTGAESQDLAASEFRLVSPDRVSLNSNASITNICPGERHSVRWSVANLGTSDTTYNVRWYLSTNRTISTYDIAIATNHNAVQNAGHFSTWQRNITIPFNIEPGLYYLGHLVDYDRRVWERRGGNNYTYMAERVRILSADDERCSR